MGAPKVVSVFWHSVSADDLPAECDSKNPSASLFRQQIEFLVGGYTPISIWEFLEILDGRRSINSYSKPPILLGFDDGFRDVVLNALPVLTEQRVPAVFFVLGAVIKDPDFVPWFVERKHVIRRAAGKRVRFRGTLLDLSSPGDRRMAYRLTERAMRLAQSDGQRQHVMSELAGATGVARPAAKDLDEDLRFVTSDDLSRLGDSSMLTVASHTLTHRHLADLNSDEQVEELRRSDAVLREYSRAYCPVVAYPAGSFNSTTVSAARSIYRSGFGVFLGASYRDRYAYPRIGFGQQSVGELRYLMGALRQNYLLPIKKWLHVTRLRRMDA